MSLMESYHGLLYILSKLSFSSCILYRHLLIMTCSFYLNFHNFIVISGTWPKIVLFLYDMAAILKCPAVYNMSFTTL